MFLKMKSPMWKLYMRLVRDYSSKVLSHDSDALNAIKAIFTKLQESGIYRAGFHWGLPLDGFDQALTWSSSYSSILVRRKGFPSWSWLGWKGRVHSGPGYELEDSTQVVFSAWKVCSQGFDRLFPDPIFDRKVQVPEGLLEKPEMSSWLSKLNPAEASQLLIAKGYILRLPIREPFSYDENSTDKRLFGNILELFSNRADPSSNIVALGTDETEHVCVLRLNDPKAGGVHAFVLLDQVCTVSEVDNFLTAVYGGWFRLDPKRLGDLPPFIANQLGAPQELRMVFLK
jgi:hypothetical protein